MTRVGIFAPLFPPAKLGGGPIRTLDALVSAVPEGFRTYVLTGDHDLGSRDRLPVPSDRWTQRGDAEVYYASATTLRGLLRGFRALRSRRPQVLYVNGFFDPRFSVLPQVLWRAGFWGRTRRLLAPRGEFGAGALSRRSAKKRAYIALYRLLRLHRGLYWHASSEAEAADIRRIWGDHARVLVRQNETQLPERALAPAPPSGDTVRAVFLGRLVEHKGLHIALEALRDVTRPVDLDVYGPAEDEEYVARCTALADSLPDTVRVRFLGAVDPEASRSTIEGHELLLMPTAGENFGHVIAEALSTSCPVMCTTLTPWTAVLRDGGGWALERSGPAWAEGVAAFVALSPAERDAARARAGEAYARWRARPAQPHVLELLERTSAGLDPARP